MPTKARTKSDFNLNELVADTLITAIDHAIANPGESAPWQAPYLVQGLPLSMSTGKPYRGINPWLLMIAASEGGYASRFWGTYDNITAHGGQVRKGEKSTMVTFWKSFQRPLKDEATGQPVLNDDGTPKMSRHAVLRYYRVFNADQCDWPDGIPPRWETIAAERTDEWNPIAEADAVVTNYTVNGGPRIEHKDQRMAWYAPATDTVNVPNPENIRGTDAYYSTTFHELTHSTGHRDRLHRDGIVGLAPHRRGRLYAFEELVAEFGAAMLCAHVGIHDTIDNSVAYLTHWRNFLTEDKDAAIKAASHAQRAVDMILGTEFPDED